MDKIQGIIIRATDYKEKDKLLDIFTPKGIITVNAKGVRSASAKLKGCVSVMTFGEFTFGTTRTGNVLSGAECVDNFFDSWGKLDKNSAIMFCFEMAYKNFNKDEETSEEFIYLLKVMREITYGQTAPLCLALKFMIFCADKSGVDYSSIREYNKTTSCLIDAFSAADIDEIGALPYSVSEVLNAIMLIHNIYKNFLGMKINTIKTLMA